MKKFSALVVLATLSLGIAGGSASCLAAEDAADAAATAQPSQRAMHRMQMTESGGQRQSDAGADHVQGKHDGPPQPSQRQMRQKLKETAPQSADAAGNSDSNR